MKTRAFAIWVVAIVILGGFGLSVQAADLPGSKDHPLLKRYEGSEIIRYDHKSYESYTIALGKAANSTKLDKSTVVEGALTRITYKVPLGRSPLEVVRNYENDMTSQEFDVLFQGGKEQLGRSFSEAAGYKAIVFRPNISALILNDGSQQYLVMKKGETGQGEMYVVIYAVENKFWASDISKIAQKGQVLVQVDVIETKAMEKKMVTVTAEEMADKIAATGGVALYGLYFDFNKAELQSQSEPALQEIAKLLKSDPKSNYLVVGHTDNVGGFNSNKELSQRRAEAVINALTQTYGIERNRLTPVGASFAGPVATNRTEEGRAKNRRVELVEYQPFC